jgi:hypothetical protein
VTVENLLHLTLMLTMLLIHLTIQYITSDGQLRCVFSRASLVSDHASVVATMTRRYSIYGQNARKWRIVANVNPGSITAIFMAQGLQIFTPCDVKGPISLACCTHNLRSHSLCHTILKIKGRDPWRDWNMKNQQKTRNCIKNRML